MEERTSLMEPVEVADSRGSIASCQSRQFASRSALVFEAATVAVLSLFAFLAINQIQAPDVPVRPESPAQFSAERALHSLQRIARAPHPMGSAEHGSLRQYLVQQLSLLGCEVDVQATTGVRDSPAAAGEVENVLGRVQGEQGTQAVLLVAHYDGVPASPAAGDDGAAVVALLETLRALRAGPPLKNDLIVLFTDGEEDGLLGASAFTREHPWAQDVRLVLNFDARGTSGPSLLFETSQGNAWLIREVVRAAPHPVGSSLFYAIYRHLPNDTDFSIFKRARWQGLNFAFIGEAANYHTSRDDIANLDRRSLSHHGSYALALARHFGNLDLRHDASPDVVFFNLLGTGIIVYPESYSLGISAAFFAFFVLLAWVNFRRHRLTAWSMLWGFLGVLAALLIAVSASALVWMLIGKLHGSVLRSGRTGDSTVYLASFLALAAAITLGGYRWLRRRLGMTPLAFGSTTVWLLLSAAAAWFLPSGSYLFQWPLASALVALGALTGVDEIRPRSKLAPTVLAWLAAALPIAVAAPMVAFLYMGLGLNLINVVAVVALVALILWLLGPVLELLTAGGWRAPGLAALAWLGLLLAGATTVRYDRDHPRTNQIIYTVDADSQRASWATFDERPDAWSVQFLTAGAKREPLPALTPYDPSRVLLQYPAPPLRFPPFAVKLMNDTVTGPRRRVTLLLNSPRRARMCLIYVSGPQVLAAQVSGRQLAPQRMSPGSQWRLQYTNISAKGVELVLTVQSGRPLQLRIVEISHGLPALGMNYRARPEDMIESGLGDLTVVSRSYQF
jgi:hypothetical protein